jgi:preprotein translocase subunit SecD
VIFPVGFAYALGVGYIFGMVLAIHGKFMLLAAVVEDGV